VKRIVKRIVKRTSPRDDRTEEDIDGRFLEQLAGTILAWSCREKKNWVKESAGEAIQKELSMEMEMEMEIEIEIELDAYTANTLMKIW
jgi:hypothetical protein